MSDFVLGPRLQSISLDTDECVIWPGAMREGYGVKKMGKTTINAHRYVYETATKKKIPKGWHIDHTCRNRRCINPKHLEPVSPSENKTRAWAFKGGNYKHKNYKGEPVEKSSGVTHGVHDGREFSYQRASDNEQSAYHKKNWHPARKIGTKRSLFGLRNKPIMGREYDSTRTVYRIKDKKSGKSWMDIQPPDNDLDNPAFDDVRKSEPVEKKRNPFLDQ